LTLERVADYPRPPRLEWIEREVEITFGGVLILRAPGAWRVMETFHPPSYYLDPDAFLPGVLRSGSARGSFCEWKGRARYWTIVAGGQVSPDAGWSYPDPTSAFADLADFVAVYAGRMDRCAVGGETVIPQPGGFYGGWITADLVGPFKGGPGTEYW
jgi:uncharacterized protein (DUF427 family)